MNALSPSPPDDFTSHGLWNLWDMLRENAESFIKLGEQFESWSVLYDVSEAMRDDPGYELSDGEKSGIKEHLTEARELCKRLRLPVAQELIAMRINDLPQTRREFGLLRDAIVAEIRRRIFLFIPQHLTIYYDSDRLAAPKVQDHFPFASREIKAAGTCLAVGLNTACVFHAMRAAELGLRAFGQSLSITLSKRIEDASWEDILGAMKSKIEDIERLPNSSPNKKEDLEFYSQGAAQFRFFKNGWRTRAAHPKDTVFEEPDARKALNDVRDYFNILVPRLREI
jgi:hypothetical protein